MNNLGLAEGFWLMKGDRVRLKKELDAVGEVLSVDLDCYPLNVFGVTIAQVLWDDAGGCARHSMDKRVREN